MLVYIDGHGRAWNDHRAERVLYRDSGDRIWRLPRHWLSDGVSPVIEASRCAITQESSWLESWCSPTWWDLWDINIQERPTANSDQGAAGIEVSVAPGEIPKAFWNGPSGKAWRIPHDWRRRRIKLPDCAGLLRNGFRHGRAGSSAAESSPSTTIRAPSAACTTDTVVDDEWGAKWPVRAADCVVVGFGDEAERYA